MNQQVFSALMFACAACSGQTPSPGENAEPAEHARFFVDQQDEHIPILSMLSWTQDHLNLTANLKKNTDMLETLGYGCSSIPSLQKDLEKFEKEHPNIAINGDPDSRTICLWTQHPSLSEDAHIPQIQVILYHANDQIILYKVHQLTFNQD